MRSQVKAFMLALQSRITDEVTRINGQAFHEDRWDREGGGGGITRIYPEGGHLLEKGGVNFSEVFGTFEPEFAKGLPRGDGLNFYATGVSLVLHPSNPWVPTVHMNYRYLERGSAGWFGGGSDLTPCYVDESDARHFHRCHHDALKPFGEDKYKTFKKNCDEYFYLPHRGEMRGVGGIFFDYQGDDPARTFEMVQECAAAFLKAYFPIAERQMHKPFTPAQKEFQEIRRGRYVEFNLLYDRGTTFGLKTKGRVESILMSLPLKARWVYDHQPRAGSEEAKLLEYLKPRDWLA
jgi:coproporphyrinogen III oxidase